MKKVVLAYVPVIHKGYLDFFNKNSDAEHIFIIDKSLSIVTPYLAKEIREVSAEDVVKGLKGINPLWKVSVCGSGDIKKISKGSLIILPDEDVSRDLAKKYLRKYKVKFDSVFLRWDKHKSMEEKPVSADQAISRSKFDKEIIAKLKTEAEKSSDWWRRVASAAIKNKKILLSAYNEHLPSPHSPYSNGDPRNTFHKGVGTDIATAIHSEARLIAEAASKGISLEGASLYVTVFPCSLCAKQIAFSGIKKIYYGGGYQLLDQAEVLKYKGIEIIYVEK
jgi:dCMP deaminase